MEDKCATSVPAAMPDERLDYPIVLLIMLCFLTSSPPVALCRRQEVRTEVSGETVPISSIKTAPSQPHAGQQQQCDNSVLCSLFV